ncbi:predicted protein [Sclerotinia sclerotiorum 1980 UF-70]|uniref:Uncharacterized protein n=1 Tax=Sclerotinia sclerotiorum (strain ATCC 18683 / 1980 / Ss-1) TaxID=665079 RepID=A7EUI6_SCLS1|nr:predicted protein [Sclerotinia sclerotiorum 1980 UF-70]EDN93128.1 predicted protein [Sclerotinia sclerotiorum 1980 UF-70]
MGCDVVYLDSRLQRENASVRLGYTHRIGLRRLGGYTSPKAVPRLVQVRNHFMGILLLLSHTYPSKIYKFWGAKKSRSTAPNACSVHRLVGREKRKY